MNKIQQWARMTVRSTDQRDASEAEREGLLEPTSEEFTVVRSRKIRRGHLWLLPAVVFLLVILFFRYVPTFHFRPGRGDDWGSNARHLSLDFDVKESFQLRQKITGHSSASGFVDIVEGKPGTRSRIEVDIYTPVGQRDYADSVTLQKLDNGVIIESEDRSFLSKVKIVAKVHVDVSKLREMTVSTVSLDINLDTPNAALRSSRLTSSSGDLHLLKAHDSRDTTIDLVSGDIKGPLKFYDSVRLHTSSGKIDIQVTPKEGRKDAEFNAETTSGDIKIIFDSFIAGRSYTTRVESSSGKISGRLPAGVELDTKTTSGDIKIEAFGTGSKHTNLRTASSSGDIAVIIDDKDIGDIDSQHSNISGNIQARYPGSWEGRLHASTMSGNIKVRGDGVDPYKRSNGPGRKELWAKKGNEERTSLVASAMSGDVTIDVGAA